MARTRAALTHTGTLAATPKSAPRRFACERPNSSELKLVEHERQHGGFESTFVGPDGTLYVRSVRFRQAEDRWYRLGKRSAGAAG